MSFVLLGSIALLAAFGYIAARWIVHRLERGPLARLEAHVLDLLRKEHHMAGEIDRLQAQVAEQMGVEASAITLIQGLKKALDAAIATGPNLAVITALSQQLKEGEDALVAAITANPLPVAGDPPAVPAPDAPEAPPAPAPDAPAADPAPAPDAPADSPPAS